MILLVAAKRRFALLFSAIAMVVSSSPVFYGVARWGTTWWANKSSIVVLAGVNAALTTSTEFISRSIPIPYISDKAHQTSFFVTTKDNKTTIHRQSLINIFMTIFASLIGGPVYFFIKRGHRFLFFVVFGVFNSLVSQAVCGLLFAHPVPIETARLIFDFLYNGSFKFFMFEWMRKDIVRSQTKIKKLGYYRVKQDLLTTFFKVTVLNLLGFKG